jgi:uncharacterized protein (TIGR03083 family)
MTDYRALMREERLAIRELARTLTPEQWDTPSLCDGWTVRDVVVHLMAWDDLLIHRSRLDHIRALARFTWLYATSMASMRILNRRLQSRRRDVALFATDDGPDLKWLFDRSNAGAHYAEYVIHHEDMRRPLGLARELPRDRVDAAIAGLRKLPSLRVHARNRHVDATLDGLMTLAGR